MNKSRPILITGSHRSGTTWVGKMLSLAKGVKYISEPFNPKTGLKVFTRWFEYVDSHNEDKYFGELKKALAFKGNFRFSLPALKYWTNIFLPGEKRPLFKDPIACLSADWLGHRFNCQVVVIIRHPLAFYSSLKRLNWRFDFNNFLSQEELMIEHLAPLELLIKKQNKTFAEEAAILWLCLYKVLSGYQKANPAWIFKRHEDLAKNPIAEFKDLYQKLNLEFSSKIEKIIGRYSDSRNAAEAKSGRALDLARDSRALADNWKNNLSKEEIETVMRITGELAGRYYEKN